MITESYIPILIFVAIASGLACLILALPTLFATADIYDTKVDPYECGFVPISDPRQTFHIRFYLVAILFVILDLEIVFLFPWAIVLSSIGLLGFYSMLSFLTLLAVGFLYEWSTGALEWQ